MVASARAVSSVASGLPFGDVPWGTNLCQLHQTSQELLDAHVPFLAAGLANNERCVWVTGPAVAPADAKAALAVLARDVERDFVSGQLVLVESHPDDWFAEIDRALASGYTGLRLATSALLPADLRGLRERPFVALCSYPLDRCSRDELAELLRHHESALIRRGSSWDRIRSVTSALALVRPPIGQSRVSKVHSVEFYERASFPAAAVAARIADGLERELASGALARPAHLDAIRSALEPRIDVAARIAAGQLVLIDALAVRAAICAAHGSYVPLEAMVATPVRAQARQFGRVQLYGELVDVFVQAGDRPGAIALERWWNRELQDHPVELHCAYQVESFGDADSLHAFHHVCEEHAAVEPVGAELRQVTAVLAAESARRAAFETAYEGSRIVEHHTRQHLVALQRVTSALCEVATLSEVAAVVAAEVQQMFGASKLALAIGPELTLLRGVTTPEDVGVLVQGLARLPASWGSPTHATAWLGARGVAVLPLVLRPDARVGTLVLGFAGRVPVEPEIRLLAEDVAHQLALTIARAGTHEEVERERERAEAAIAAKDQFLAMLGHELRNPLSPILTATQLMLLRAPDACVKERTIIERSVAHMVRLVDDLLDISRITSGRVELARQHLELAGVITDALERIGTLIAERSHRVTVDVAEGLTLEADPIRLAQVVGNVLNNAAKYTKPGGEIAITARRCGDEIELAIVDTGIGISPDLLPRVFEMFVQGPQSVDRPKGGLGLGLTIANKILELHGGTIRAESGGTNLGSRFVITLPTQPEQQPAAAELPALETGKRRILVVDDNEDAAWLLAEGLRMGGHDVRVSHDGLEALELAREFLPQIAFLDVGLPGIDGYTLCEHLCALSVRPKVVAVTGYGQDADRDRARAAGFDLHFVKPVSLREMQSAVETFSK